MKQNDLSLSQIQAVIDGLDHYFPQDNSQNVYVNDTWEDFNKMYKWRGRDDYFTTLSEITGVEKITDIKVATQKLYELRETLTKTPEYNEVNLTQTPEYTETTTTNSVTPDEGTREVQAEELEYRETETEKSRQVAKQKELDFEKRVRSIKSRIFLKPKNNPNEIQLTKTQKEFIHNLALASTKDAGTTREYIEGLIKSSIPKDRTDEYPDALIKNRSANFVQGLRIFSNYKSPDEIPDVLVVTPPYSPLTSLINPNDQKMVDIFTDNYIRNQIAKDAQQTILTLSTQRDVDAEIFEPTVFSGDKNLTAVFFGGNQIEEYEISDTQQDGSIEITVSDLESLHKNSQEIESFIDKYLQIENQNIPVVSTGFVPLRIPESELKSVDKTILKTKSTIGGIEGEETQGALARKILREKAKLINQVVTITPNTNPEIVNETKNILSKISGEVVPKTIVKNLAPKSINLSVYIGEGVKPVTIAVTGEFGGSTESFLTLLEKNGTPLFFTSLAIGEYAKNQAIFSQAIASEFNGRLLMQIGAGKYSFEIINAGNTILGGVPLSRYVATLQLGGRSLGLEVTKKAGKIISSTLIKTAGGVTTRTVLPSFITKIIAAVGGATGPVGLAISATIGWLIGKVIQLIGKIIPPEKIKKFLTNTKEIIFGTGLVGLYLGVTTGSVLAMGLGTIGTIAGAGTAFATGGFSTTGLVTGVNGITSALGTAFSFALAGIAGPILFILLGFPVIVALILFIINSGAYVVPPSTANTTLDGSQTIISPYIEVTKTANPAGPFQNTQLPITVEYTITITAKKGQLSNVKIEYDCNVTKKSGSTNCPSVTPNIPEALPDGVSPLKPESFKYKQTYTSPNFIDSLVTDTLTVNATTADGQNAEAAASLGIKIGNPPDQCPNGWPVAGNFVITQTPGGSYSHRSVEAIDIGTPMGTPVRATHSGVANVVKTTGAYRPVYITITSVCGGKQFQSWYAHLSSVSIVDGQQVTMGQLLGTTGTAGSGPHLHYEFRGLTMSVPYIPKTIKRNCSSDSGSCGSIP